MWKSFRNLGDRVQIVLPEELNAYDVLVNDWLVFSTGDARGRGRPPRSSDDGAERTSARGDAADRREPTTRDEVTP